MEEEDSDEGYTPTMGFADTAGFHDLLERLVRERSEIIKMIEIQKLKVGEATRLLEQNSQLIGRVRGRYSFGTEKVIYSILGFSAIVIVTLSWLTAWNSRPLSRGHQNVEPALRQANQFAVFLSGQACFGYRLAVMRR
jgi:hypothetical protein